MIARVNQRSFQAIAVQGAAEDQLNRIEFCRGEALAQAARATSMTTLSALAPSRASAFYCTQLGPSAL